MMMALSGLAAVVGPLLGGVLTDKLSWRWLVIPTHLNTYHFL